MNYRVMTVLAASLWIATVSWCAAQAVCSDDAGCPRGFTCKLKTPPPCPPRTRCDYVVAGQCEPGPCEHDSDCADGSVCAPKDAGISCPAQPLPCLPNGICPRVRVACTRRTCTPRYLLPCADADSCGPGFCCEDATSGEGTCVSLPMSCDSDGDCPAFFGCRASEGEHLCVPLYVRPPSPSTPARSDRTVCDEEGASAQLHAADYDQHCESDADCVAVPDGDVCLPCVLACATGAINAQAQAQYLDDLSQLTVSPLDDAACQCPAKPVAPCCIAGVCNSDLQCD